MLAVDDVGGAWQSKPVSAGSSGPLDMQSNEPAAVRLSKDATREQIRKTLAAFFRQLEDGDAHLKATLNDALKSELRQEKIIDEQTGFGISIIVPRGGEPSVLVKAGDQTLELDRVVDPKTRDAYLEQLHLGPLEHQRTSFGGESRGGSMARHSDSSPMPGLWLNLVSRDSSVSGRGARAPREFGPLERPERTTPQADQRPERRREDEQRLWSVPAKGPDRFVPYAATAAGPSTLSFARGVQRVRYESLAKSASGSTMRAARFWAKEGRLGRVALLSREAFEKRETIRRVGQSRLPDLGSKVLSRWYQKSPDYGSLLAKRSIEVGGIKDSKSFLEAHFKMIEKAGQSNRVMSFLGRAGLLFGGAMMVGGTAVILQEIWSAPEGQGLVVASKELSRAAFAAAGSSLGGALGAATLGIVLAPEAAILVGFAAGSIAGAAVMTGLVEKVIETLETPGGSYEGALDEWLRTLSPVHPPSA